MNDTMADWTSGEARIVVSACRRCQNHWYLPRHHCPVCGSAQADRIETSGVGLCVAVTRLHVTADESGGPIQLTLVELDEGPLVLGRVHGTDLRPGDRARVAFLHVGHEQQLVPSFEREAATR